MLDSNLLRMHAHGVYNNIPVGATLGRNLTEMLLGMLRIGITDWRIFNVTLCLAFLVPDKH